jgi:hypothetical protein
MSTIDSISEALGRIEGKLDSRIQEHDKAHTAQDKRFGRLENSKLASKAQAGGLIAVVLGLLEGTRRLFS